MSVARVEVEIDLSQVEQAKLASPKHYFHQPLYSKLVSQVMVQARKSERIQNCDQPDDINQTRSHEAILLDGPRGCGKTSILVNLRSYMQSEKEDIRNLQQKILFLNPVDPTLLNEKEDFLNIVLGQINSSEEVLKARDQARQQHADAYERALEDLANAMEGEQTLKDRFGLDRIFSYQGGLEINKHAHAFFREVLRLTGKKLILLPIDDVDMALKHGMKVLEVVRKYLCSPHFLPIVSGDLALYEELVNNHFASALVESSRGSSAQQSLLKQAADLAKEYLRKVFPIHNRHTVPSVEGYLHGRTANGEALVAIVCNSDHNPLIDLASLGHLVHAALNGRVNGDEQSAVTVTIPTARQLIQFLKSLENVLSQSLKESKQSNEAIPLAFQNRAQAVAWWLQQSREKAMAFYEALATYFNYTQNLRLQHLCEALATLNQSSTEVNVELSQLTYLNLKQQVEMDSHALPYVRQSETYALYNSGPWIAPQFDLLPETLRKKELRTLAPLPAVEPLDRKLKFTRSWKALSSDDQFLLELLTHSDFYTSYQTANLVFFGKFFELLTTSLMRDLDSKWLQSLLNRPPYYSIFDVSGTKTFEFEDDTDTVPDEEFSQTGTSKLSKEYIDEIVGNINQFRAKAGLNNVGFADISIVHAVQSKFFNQVNLLKKAGHVSSVKKALRNDSVPDTSNLLLELARRAMYTYWSALGSFELGDLYFSTQQKVAHQNFGSVGQIALGALDNNQGFLLNIKPFLELDDRFDFGCAPLTQLLQEHPIFSMIDSFAAAVKALPRATMTGKSNFEVHPTVTNNPVPASDLSARRPKHYNALSALIKKPFLQAHFEKCVNADRDQRYGLISHVIRPTMSQLGPLAYQAAQNNAEAAAALLINLGKNLKEAQFYNQRNRLDKFLIVIYIAARDHNIDLNSRSAVMAFLEDLGARPEIAEAMSDGV